LVEWAYKYLLAAQHGQNKMLLYSEEYWVLSNFQSIWRIFCVLQEVFEDSVSG